jgi:hypothetical protein
MNSTVSGVSRQRRNRRRIGAVVLVLLALTVLAIVLVPVFLIMPFSPQTPRGMVTAYWMRRLSPSMTLLASLASVALLIWLERGARWWRKALLVSAVIPIFAATWLARQNHFEWMFNPLPNPAYAKAAEASFVDDNDRVMAIAIGDEAVAYPIRLMAYHHVVADTVGGTHVVATY